MYIVYTHDRVTPRSVRLRAGKCTECLWKGRGAMAPVVVSVPTPIIKMLFMSASSLFDGHKEEPSRESEMIGMVDYLLECMQKKNVT